MSIVTAVVLSLLFLTVTSCATSSPPAAKQEKGKKDSAKKAIKHDQRKAMNEESENAIR